MRISDGSTDVCASDLVLIVTDIGSGFCAAVVGLIIASELQGANPATGDTFGLNAIAAAVLGGASLAGGRGTIVGTLVGAAVIGVLGDWAWMGGQCSVIAPKLNAPEGPICSDFREAGPLLSAGVFRSSSSGRTTGGGRVCEDVYILGVHGYLKKKTK